MPEPFRVPFRASQSAAEGDQGSKATPGHPEALKGLCDALRGSVGIAHNGIRYSLLGATVIVASDEQPDASRSGYQEPLCCLPSLFRDEGPLPSGDGLPPPSQAFIAGLEPDLPAADQDD